MNDVIETSLQLSDIKQATYVGPAPTYYAAVSRIFDLIEIFARPILRPYSFPEKDLQTFWIIGFSRFFAVVLVARTSAETDKCADGVLNLYTKQRTNRTANKTPKASRDGKRMRRRYSFPKQLASTRN